MIDPNRLTHKAQETLALALQTATDNSHSTLEDIHLLHALITIDGISRDILNKLLPDLTSLQKDVGSALARLPQVSNPNQPSISPSASQILSQADKLTQTFSDQFIPQELLLLSLLESNTPASQILKDHQLDNQTVIQEIKSMRRGESASTPGADQSYNVLEKYTISLTQRAKEGKLDPVIGRDSEIRRVMQVLSRRTKNNPVLIGDPGVGKTAIVEGLAQRIYAGDVPESLQGKDLLVLDIASVLAGAKFRGEFEERLKAILKQITSESDRFIVFIDELHTIVGAGSAEGAVDASNMLKPGLARGELHIIGATTLNEYRQHIEKDAALERRFQPVYVGEPSLEDTIAILRGLKEKYEVHHGLAISDDAIVAAANLSNRYLTDRFLPDKAIDLLDEASSAIKIQSQSKPEVLDNLNRRITQIEIEKQALKSEKGPATKQKRQDLDKQLADLKEESQQLSNRWQQQKDLLEKINGIREEIDQLKARLEDAQRQVELEEAAKIQYGQLPEKQKQLEALEQEWADIPENEKLIKEIVSSQDIASVVSRWTGIPMTKLLKQEAQKLANLERQLHQRVIDQEDAIKAVADAIRRSRVGLSSQDKPIATFLFLGPTGVGKTETAKALAEVMFDDRRSLVRIDMSEYSERHSVARLIGAPPGYVGYEQGGQLTEAVRRRPYSIILLDEIEKAHEEIFNVFLQVFDDGRLTDGQGRTVDFRNTIIIMTSNLASKQIQELSQDKSRLQQEVWGVLRSRFAPEFINRIDQIIIFEKLSRENVLKIVDLELHKVSERLEEQGFKLEVTQDVKKRLADLGYDPQFGARPLERTIQSQILDRLANLLTTESIPAGSTLKASLKDDRIEVTHT